MKVIVDTLRGRVNSKQGLHFTCILGAAEKMCFAFHFNFNFCIRWKSSSFTYRSRFRTLVSLMDIKIAYNYHAEYDWHPKSKCSHRSLFSKASWLHLPACFISIPSVSETCMCERQRKARTWMGTCSEWCTCRMRDNELWVAILWCKPAKCILLFCPSTATLSFCESQFHDAFCSIVLSISATVFHYNFFHTFVGQLGISI